jgi:hypothetical protein
VCDIGQPATCIRVSRGLRGALHDRTNRLGGRGRLRGRGNTAAALELGTGNWGLDMAMSPVVAQPRTIVAMWARLFLIAGAAGAVLLLIA